MVENAPKMTAAEAMEKVKDLPNKVTKESIEGRIAEATYRMVDHLTICVIRMVNDFRVVGVSAPADPKNYDEEVGKTYAYDNAFKQLWQLEGYLLRENLWIESQPEVASKRPKP